MSSLKVTWAEEALLCRFHELWKRWLPTQVVVVVKLTQLPRFADGALVSPNLYVLDWRLLSPLRSARIVFQRSRWCRTAFRTSPFIKQ